MNVSEKELRDAVMDGLAPRLRILGVAREAVDDDLDLFVSGVRRDGGSPSPSEQGTPVRVQLLFDTLSE